MKKHNIETSHVCIYTQFSYLYTVFIYTTLWNFHMFPGQICVCSYFCRHLPPWNPKLPRRNVEKAAAVTSRVCLQEAEINNHPNATTAKKTGVFIKEQKMLVQTIGFLDKGSCRLSPGFCEEKHGDLFWRFSRN